MKEKCWLVETNSNKLGSRLPSGKIKMYIKFIKDQQMHFGFIM